MPRGRQRHRDAEERGNHEPAPDSPSPHRHKRVAALPPLPDGDRTDDSPQPDAADGEPKESLADAQFPSASTPRLSNVKMINMAAELLVTARKSERRWIR